MNSLANLEGKGGGGLSGGTVLWENPAQNPDITAVTLSDSMQKYNYIGIRFLNGIGLDQELELIMRYEDLKGMKGTQGTAGFALLHYGVSYNPTRTMAYVDDTHITFGSAGNYGVPLVITGY